MRTAELQPIEAITVSMYHNRSAKLTIILFSIAQLALVLVCYGMAVAMAEWSHDYHLHTSIDVHLPALTK